MLAHLKISSKLCSGIQPKNCEISNSGPGNIFCKSPLKISTKGKQCKFENSDMLLSGTTFEIQIREVSQYAIAMIGYFTKAWSI